MRLPACHLSKESAIALVPALAVKYFGWVYGIVMSIPHLFVEGHMGDNRSSLLLSSLFFFFIHQLMYISNCHKWNPSLSFFFFFFIPMALAISHKAREHESKVENSPLNSYSTNIWLPCVFLRESQSIKFPWLDMAETQLQRRAHPIRTPRLCFF